MSKYGTNGSGIFLSTPSARRATSFSMRLRLPTRNFYPRPPRGGRHDLRAGQGPRSEISIHALREEGDGSDLHQSTLVGLFLSTPSARRATHDYFTSALPSPQFLSTPSARRATICSAYPSQTAG